MKPIFYFVPVLSILLSCAIRGNEVVPTLNIGNVPNGETLFMSELCSEIDYVPLDTGKRIILDNQRYYKLVDDYLFVLEYREVKRLTGYNINTGQQLFEISNIGNGPNEMVNPVAFFPNIKKQQIEIFDSIKRKLFFFDFKGNLVKVADFEFFITEFTRSPNGDYFFYTGRAINHRDHREISESLIVTDSGFEIKKAFFPGNTNLEMLNISSARNFVWNNDQLYFIQSPDYTLYRITSERADTVLKLDFGANNIPDDLRENNEGLRLREWVRIVRDRGYFMGISDYFTNDKFELIEFISIKNKEHYYVKYDKSFGSFDYYSKNNFRNDIDNGVVGALIHLDNKRLITFVEAYELREHLKKHPEFDNKEVLRLLQNEKFDNPVLMIYKLR